MVIPQKVLNRLHLGRPVAAMVAATRPNFRAWVYIKPILNKEGQRWTSSGSGERYLSSNQASPIEGYIVRHLEIPERYVDFIYESDNYMQDPSTLDERTIVFTEDELANVLTHWLEDFTQLRIPVDVLCPDFPLET